MPRLTAKVIGAEGSMGREHVAAYRECGVKIVDVAPDIVSIASPDDTHAEYVIEALKAGAHVFCEKPLATNLDDMKKIMGLIDEKCVWQNFPLRYQPLFIDLKEKIKDFGEIYRIEASYNWGRTYKLYESWRNRNPDYSLVMGGMIHMIDLAIWLTEREIEPIMAAGVNLSAPGFPGPDTVTALCRMDNGGICNFTVDGGTGVDKHNHRITIHGTKGGITVVNHEPTNKQACIFDFVEMLEKKDYRSIGLYSAFVALMIDDGRPEAQGKVIWE